MGVTGAIFKGLTFDGEDSKDYGVYITGQAVYNSPERDVEMISIPGRDGAFALDRGRFSNIEVTYPAGLFGVDEADFAQAIADFRNMLGSRVGYCRLEDEYNPGEYREAVFKAGLEVTPASLESGQFDIVFECKPQRWLTSGEERLISFYSPYTVTNPTLFESHPLLWVSGYGQITINGKTIEIVSKPLGIIELPWSMVETFEAVTAGGQAGIHTTQTITFDTTFLNPGDDITISPFPVSQSWVTTYSATSATTSQSNFYVNGVSTNSVTIRANLPAMTSGAPQTWSWNDSSIAITAENGGSTYTAYTTMNVVVQYDGIDTITVDIWGFANTSDTWITVENKGETSIAMIRGNSTQSALGPTVYIDLDIGEAYRIENGQMVSINNAVVMPPILPTLPPGSTSIVYDDSNILELDIVPRWWQL